jgi:hypothetical protein
MAGAFSVRRRGQIGIPEFLQFRTRIPDLIGTGTCEGDGSVCAHPFDGGLAGDLHADNSREIAKQGAPAGVVALIRIGPGWPWRRIFRVISRVWRTIDPSLPADQTSAGPHSQDGLCHYFFGQRNSSRYSGVCSGAKPWRATFSVTTRGTRKCRR